MSCSVTQSVVTWQYALSPLCCKVWQGITVPSKPWSASVALVFLFNNVTNEITCKLISYLHQVRAVYAYYMHNKYCQLFFFLMWKPWILWQIEAYSLRSFKSLYYIAWFLHQVESVSVNFLWKVTWRNCFTPDLTFNTGCYILPQQLSPQPARKCCWQKLPPTQRSPSCGHCTTAEVTASNAKFHMTSASIADKGRFKLGPHHTYVSSVQILKIFLRT